MSIAFNIVNGRITGYVNGKNVSIEQSHPNYDKIREMLAVYADTEQMDVEKFLLLTDIPKTIHKISQGKVVATETSITYNGKEIDPVLQGYILEVMKQKLPFKPLLRFVENCYKNPSKTARERLFLWLQKREFPITEDGCFLGYKGVTNDYKDGYSQTYDNSIGANPKMERNECDDDWGKECSEGFHVGTWEYASTFSQRTVLVKVNPKDVVSVPLETLSWKLRCCEYIVVEDATERQTNLYAENYNDVDYDYEDDYSDDEDDEYDGCNDYYCSCDNG